MVDSKIIITGLVVRTIIGAHAHEQDSFQSLSIDLSFSVNLDRAASADLLSDTCDYAAVCHSIIAFSERSRYRLLETFSKNLSDHLSQQFQLMDLTLSVTKKPKDLPNVSVTLKAVESVCV